MAPGDVAHVPRTPLPVAEAGPVAEHFRSRARLRRLLVRLRRPTPQRSLRSLRRRGFAHYVRLRHYRSSLFCCRKIIPSHSFAALTALVVRHENGNVALLVCRGNGLVDQPRLACTSRRTPSVGALACAPGGGTLPPALVVRRVKGFVDQPRLASTSRRTPPVGALACAPGSGTLPPHLAAAPCRLFYGICCFQQKAYSNYTKVGCDCQ